MVKKNMIIAIVAAVVIIVAAAAAVLVLNNGGNGPAEKPEAYDDSDVRLRIFGNANGDDVIDDKDVKAIQGLIDNEVADWKKTNYFADANHDGKIDDKDVEVVKKIIAKESVKMWYETSFSTKDTVATGENKRLDAYVNYPIGTKVGCEYTTVDFLSVLGVYNYFKATDSTMANNYGDSTYPGISKLPSMGERNNLTLEDLGQMNREGIIDTVIMWSGGTSTMYLWDKAVSSGLADKVSMVMVTCQGKGCVNGVLMLAAMFGDQTLSDKYVNWYDKGMAKLGEIGKTVDKKTVLVVQMFENTKQSSLQAYKQYQSPALWFSEVLNFVDNCAGVPGFLKLGSSEALQTQLKDYNTTEMVVMTQPAAQYTYENYNGWVEKKMNDLFVNLPIYEQQKIYTIDFGLMPFFGGPAACYLLAAQLYSDAFTMEDAMTFTQEYLDNFMPAKHDARQGFTYTGEGYYPYKG